MSDFDITKPITTFFNIKTGKYRSFHKIEYEGEEIIYIYHSAKNKFILIHAGKTDKKGFELNPEMHILHLKENFLD